MGLFPEVNGNQYISNEQGPRQAGWVTAEGHIHRKTLAGGGSGVEDTAD